MIQPKLPPLFRDPEVLAYRSSAPLDGSVAARLAAALSQPTGRRDWVQKRADRGPVRTGAARFLFGEAWLDRSGPDAYADILWMLAQLGRVARDEHVEFEVQLGKVEGRVSTGGLDQGAQRILHKAQGRPPPPRQPGPARSKRRHATPAPGRAARGAPGAP